MWPMVFTFPRASVGSSFSTKIFPFESIYAPVGISAVVVPLQKRALNKIGGVARDILGFIEHNGTRLDEELLVFMLDCFQAIPSNDRPSPCA